MKKLYFTLIFFSICLFVTAQSSSEVGTTEGHLSVSLSGGANYTIPIAVPSGINGVVPKVNLSYNSQGGNGIAGYGWNLNGVSTITRIPSTKYHDGVVDPVDFDSLDRFALDGQRLIVKNGTSGVYGGNGTVYETEKFSNLKITSFGVHPDGAKFGPAYFLVEYPDGSKAYFGYSPASRSIMEWSITSWENPQKVNIIYYYVKSDNNLNILSIKYGTLSNELSNNEVNFVYATRQRSEQGYVGGLSVVKSKILKEINVLGNHIGFRNYILDYQNTQFDYQRLIRIIEKTGDDTRSYNPTEFTYEPSPNLSVAFSENSTFLLAPPKSMPESAYNKTVYGDFDANGKWDLITYSQQRYNRKAYDFFEDLGSDVATRAGTRIETGHFEELLNVNFLSGNASTGYKLKPNTGWCIVKTDTITNTTSFSVYSKGKQNLIDSQYSIDYKFPRYCDNTGKSNEATRQFLSGDFNGDGISDIIVIDRGTNTNDTESGCNENSHPYREDDRWGNSYFINLDKRISSGNVKFLGKLEYVSAVDKYSGLPVYSRLPLPVLGQFISTVVSGDADGDGKTDIVVVGPSIEVYSLDDNNNLIKRSETELPSYTYNENAPVQPGDFNGDGKTDILIGSTLYMSKGDGFVLSSTPPVWWSYSSWSGDYNNDGKIDFIQLSVDTDYHYKLRVAINKKDGTFTDYTVKGPRAFNAPNVLIPLYSSTLSHKNEIAFYNYTTSKIHYIKVNSDISKEKLLKNIVDGNGVEKTITYSSLTNGNGVYIAADNKQNYPNKDIVAASAYSLVSKLEEQSPIVYRKQLYCYYGAVSNSDGFGFLGFQSIRRTNWHDENSPVISYISKYDMALRGANTENYTVLGLHEPLRGSENQIESVIIKQGNYTITGTENLKAQQSITLQPDTWIRPGSTFTAQIDQNANNSPNAPEDFITKSQLIYESNLLPNKVFKLQNTITKQFNGLENTSSEQYITYDQNNNPLKSTTLLKESEAVVQTTVSNTIYEAPMSSPYIVGRPLSKTKSITVTGDVTTSEELYTYQNNLLTRIKKKGNNTDYITEDNTYDVFGNITKKILTATGLAPRITSYTYSSSGRFLVKSTDTEGLSTTFSYNLDNGLLMSETNPYGLTTSYLYDSWFRKTKTIDYLGRSTTYVYTRDHQNTIVTSVAENGNSTEETFDALGRKIKEGSKNIMGTFSNLYYLYDLEDRKCKISEPYFGLTTTKWNETKFDAYGREIQHIAFTGKTTDITYSGLSTTVDDGTMSKTTVKNAIGNVVSITDNPGGTIKYTYFANGNLKESDYGGVKTVISQDGWGRKTKLVDSSAGTYTYDYNAFGETISTTTPNGTTNYILDDTGKVTQKNITGTNTNSKTTYLYDSSSKLLLSSIFEDLNNDGSIIENSITYDDSKRISKTVEKTPYAVFTKDYVYDAFGRVHSESLTASSGGKSSSKTIRSTYKNGSHWQLLDNGTSAILWQANSINANGQLISAQNGPTTIANTYDSNSLISQTKYSKTLGSSNILILNTVFDAQKDNLTSRTNSLFNTDESFKYDAQDRLTEFTNAQGVQEKQDYDNQGRITQNSLGTYGYSKDKPYQNASINPTPEALEYYIGKPTQNISYNSFKSPVQIQEKDIDKISFIYNDNDSRTAMFYGGLQDDKLERPLRKYYSVDGSMEIKENKSTGVFEFVTYIGGDGYDAPIAVKSNGTTQDYLYLQRDYQGSIVAITNQAGEVVEKRLFDVWGAIAKVQDGAGNAIAGLSILDRGYTGHEHLQSVGLINMNGRIYDPKLRRFLQPDNNIQDPFNTQNYNRYGYVLNNPLKYNDKSGEFWGFVVKAVGFLFSTYVHGGAASGEANPLKWDSDTWSGAILGSASSFGSNQATLFTNDYIDDYNNKPALGASAINSGNGFYPFGNDNDYIPITAPKNEEMTSNENAIPCVICHHSLDRGSIFDSELLEPESRFGNGVMNTVFGTVATVGAVVAIPETGGGSGLALSLTIGQISIGVTQMATSFDDNPNKALHSSSTVPGLIMAQRGSKYAPVVDFAASWGAGSLNSAKFLGNIKGLRESANSIYQGEKIIYNGTSIYSTSSTGYSGYLLYKNSKK